MPVDYEDNSHLYVHSATAGRVINPVEELDLRYYGVASGVDKTAWRVVPRGTRVVLDRDGSLGLLPLGEPLTLNEAVLLAEYNRPEGREDAEFLACFCAVAIDHVPWDELPDGQRAEYVAWAMAALKNKRTPDQA